MEKYIAKLTIKINEAVIVTEWGIKSPFWSQIDIYRGIIR